MENTQHLIPGFTPAAEQNAAHRTSRTWVATPGKESIWIDDEMYVREYVNAGTAQAIRKSWRMTGLDWILFDAQGRAVSAHPTLTMAKQAALRAQEGATN